MGETVAEGGLPAAEGGLLVPAYLHPASAPESWRALGAAGPASGPMSRPASGAGGSVAYVVVNPADGPGAAAEDCYAEAAAALRAAGVRVLGYVDTDYGSRPHAEVLADARRHLAWYGVDGFFLDQVASASELLPHYRRLAIASRALSEPDRSLALVLNPGTVPDPCYLDVGDILVTFEGSWAQYQEHRPPAWTASVPAARFCHLVHEASPTACERISAEAFARHAAFAYATPGLLPNPWAVVPPAFRS